LKNKPPKNEKNLLINVSDKNNLINKKVKKFVFKLNINNNFNNININNNVDNLNNQFNNMNLNNMNNLNQDNIGITKKIINNNIQNINSKIETQNIIIQNENMIGNNINNDNNNQNDTTLNFLRASDPNFNSININTNIQYNYYVNNNNNYNAPLMKENRSNSNNININFNSGISNEINPPLKHAMSLENPNIQINNFQIPNNDIIYGNLNIPKGDILKSIVFCLSNCDVLFQNIINMNEGLQNMPIISSLQYIFKNADYTNGIFKLRGNLASKGFIDLENPKNIFIFILDNINNEIGGGFNPNQSNSSFLSKHSNNKNKLYEDFVNQIFTPLNHTFISNNFFGIREVISKCNTCKYENYNLDIFRFLEFSVEEVQKFLVNKLPDYIQGEKSNPKRFLEISNNNAKRIITLNDCFDCYSNNIAVMNNIIISCKNCKEKSDNPKGKFGLKKMPKILCILIENKKDYKVSLKLEEKLNIEKYVNSETIKEYNLVSAVIKTSENDTYNTLIKNMNDNNWYLNLENNSVPFNTKTEKQVGKPFLLIYKAK
jgi:hypothetical protein